MVCKEACNLLLQGMVLVMLLLLLLLLWGAQW
jgi:hypothetical protein